jgi:hypothetical protein
MFVDTSQYVISSCLKPFIFYQSKFFAIFIINKTMVLKYLITSIYVISICFIMMMHGNLAISRFITSQVAPFPTPLHMCTLLSFAFSIMWVRKISYQIWVQHFTAESLDWKTKGICTCRAMFFGVATIGYISLNFNAKL